MAAQEKELNQQPKTDPLAARDALLAEVAKGKPQRSQPASDEERRRAIRESLEKDQSEFAVKQMVRNPNR